MHRDNWDDLRFVLAVADHGSVSSAARALGVNHATVLRRVAVFEERHGCQIFEKTQRGYATSPESQAVLAAMREVDEAILAVRRVIAGSGAALGGTVRITSSDTLCAVLLPEVVAELNAFARDLRVDLISSNARLDLARMAADVSVRPAPALPEKVSGLCAGETAFGVYRRTGSETEQWLGPSGEIARAKFMPWFEGEVLQEQIVGRADSFLTLQRLAAAGLGKAVLPRMLGDDDPRLERVLDAMPHITVPIWVACHEDLAEVPRIRAVRDFLARAIAPRIK